MIGKLLRRDKANAPAPQAPDAVLRGMERMVDLIAPSAIGIHPDRLDVGGMQYTGLFASQYPRFVRFGWLSRLYRHPGNVDIALHITPVDPRTAIEALTDKMARFGATLQQQVLEGKVTDIQVEAVLEDAEQLRRKLQFGEESLFEVGLYFGLFESDPKRLEALVKEVEFLAGAAGMQTRRALYRQLEHFNTVLPAGDDYIGHVRNFTTSALATAFPFVSPQLSSTDGMPVFLGLTEDRAIVMFDIFSMPSFNSCIIARTGAGKSYLAKLLALRHLYMGVDVVVIDPKGEYVPLARAVGGQVIKLSLASDQHVNIFDIDAHEVSEGQDFLSAKILSVFRFISMLLGGQMSPRERNLLLQCIERCYAERGITRDPRSLYEGEPEVRAGDRVLLRPRMRKKRMPTMGDLNRILRQEGGDLGRELAEQLQPYVTGVYSSVFNAETNVDMDNRFLVFDVSDMQDELAPYATFVSLEWLWTRIKRQPKKRIILIDEAWRLLLGHKESAEYMAMLARTARQFWGGIMVITQQPQDVLGSEHGIAIISNAEIRILLRQDRGNLDELGQLFKLSEEEKSYLAQCDRGSALLIAGNQHILVSRILAFPHEHPLITTDPAELARMRDGEGDEA